jgi:parallel beta-helix repeat protein
VDEGGTQRDISIRRTVSNGALTVHFRLAPSSEVSASEIELSIRRGASNLTSENGVYSLVIPDGTSAAELYVIVLADPTDQAEAAENILLEFAADDAYTIAAGKNVTHFTSTPSGLLVTNTSDFGTGSLRQALLNANLNADLSIVTFSDGTGGFPNFSDGTHRTISLSSELFIDEDTILEGPGKCFLSITGNSDGDLTKEAGETRIFRISSKGGGGFVAEEITLRDGIAENANPGFGSTDNEGGLILIDNRETIARIENCTLIGGRAGQEGGVISNDSSSGLTIVDCDIVACHARFRGGALLINNRATVLSLRCRISGNSTNNKGGGIYVDSGDNTVIRECLISNNIAEGAEVSGGGIFVDSVVTIIADCHIVGNRAIARYNSDSFISGGARGGGIAYSTAIAPAPQLLVNTTIADNTVFGDSSASGGGIYVFISPIQNAGGIDSPLRFFGCSIIGNRAEQSGLGLPFDLRSSGGGIHFIAATPGTLLDSCTITGNEAEDGSGISILNGQGIRIDIYQSIVAGNIGEDIGGTNANNPPRARGSVTSAGYNLIGTGPFFSDFTAVGDRTGVTDPGINPIRYDGGRFPTYTLALDSPARDACDPAPEHEEFMFGTTSWIANLLDADQRRNGFARTIGGRTDIGSIEFDPATPETIEPEILSLTGNALAFKSIPGHTYTLEVSQDLTYFIRLDKPVTATSILTALTDPAPVSEDGSRYYRIAEIPTP